MTTTARSPRTGATLAIVSLALFMVVLDNLIVTVALPAIRADLGASLQSLEWTINAYTLAFAVNAVAARISLPGHVSREDLLSCAHVALVEVAGPGRTAQFHLAHAVGE